MSPAAGYSGTPLSKKLGIREGMALAVLNAPAGYRSWLDPFPEGARIVRQAKGKLAFIHFFPKSESELRKTFPRLEACLTADGMIWVSWPKKSAGMKTDLGEGLVREIGLDAGLVDVKVCAVSETWSGLKFVRRLKDR